jgi:hypothetical protein
MDYNQAKARVLGVTTATVKAAAPGASPRGSTEQFFCVPPNVDKVYYVHTINLPRSSVEHNRELARTIERYWRRQGYRILGADFKSGLPAVVATTQDGIQLTFDSNPVGDAWIEADSPCVAPATPLPWAT